MALVSHAHVREKLREAVTGARVTTEAVETVARELDQIFERIVERASERYNEERCLRQVHGVHPSGYIRVDHVQADRTVAEEARDARASPEIT